MLEDRIVIDPKVRHGKPIIRGTRVPVDLILGSLAAGLSPAEIAREYDIEKEDVLASLGYAAKIVAGERIGALFPPDPQVLAGRRYARPGRRAGRIDIGPG